MGFDGKGSERRLEQDVECPECKCATQTYFRGSDVLNGNPYSPASDTEIEMRHWSRLT